MVTGVEASSQRVIVITGAGKGIGLAIAERFARAGDHLVLNDLAFSETARVSVTESSGQNGGATVFLTGDISSPQEAAQLIEESVRRFGRIDVLVNNAGILRCRPSHEMEWAEWRQIIDVNLGGTWNCIRSALPFMLKQKSGRIINISSELGISGSPAYAAYSASKGGVIALTKALAKEYAPHGILVNSVAPGPVETDLLINDSLEFNEAVRDAVPLRRFGFPDEIARSVEFLAGPGGSFYVGQIISPNGGVVM